MAPAPPEQDLEREELFCIRTQPDAGSWPKTLHGKRLIYITVNIHR